MAQGFKVADAYVHIHTEDDTREGRNKVERETSRWASGLGAKLGKIISLGMLRGIGKALFQALMQTAKLAAFGLIAGIVASAVGGLAAAIAELIPLIAELVNVLIAASGALLLIPGAIAGIIAIVATAKLGMKGFGEALKAVGSGDAKVLAEALKKLAPEARKVVRALAGLKPMFDKMRLKIQNTLFANLSKLVQDLGRRYIPILSRGLGEIAQILNGIVRAGIEFLLQAQTRLDIARILANTAVSARNLRDAFGPLLQILRDVVVVSSQVLALLTRGLPDTLGRFADKIAEMRESGELAQMIMDGIAALKVLGALLGDIVGIIKGLVSAAGGAGGLFSFFDKLNELINSVSGQSALKAIFTDLNRIGVALIPVLMMLLKALVPVIDGIAKIAVAFSPGLVILAGALGQALSNLATPIAALAPLLGIVASGLGPLAQILGDLVVAAAPGLAVFLQAIVDALIVLAPIAPVVGKALGDLFEALAPLLEVLGPALAFLLGEVAIALSALAKLLGPVVKLMSQAFGEALRRLIPPLLELGVKLLPLFVEAGVRIAQVFAPLVPILMQFLEMFLDRLAIHMPMAIELFGRLLEVVVELAAVFGEALLAALIELTPQMPELIDAFFDLAKALLDLLVALAPILPPLAHLLLKMMEASIESGAFATGIHVLISVLEAITGIINFVSSIVRDLAGTFRGGRQSVEQFGKAVMVAIGNAIGTIRTLGSSVVNAVRNFGTLLFNSGRSLIAGLINGIKSMLPSLGGIVSQGVNLIRGFFNSSPAKWGPLAGRGDMVYAGQNLVGRLTTGISSRFGALRSTMGELAGLARFGPDATLAGAGGMAVPLGAAAAGAGSKHGPYYMEVDGRVLAAFVIDTVTGEPETIAATADEGRRFRGFVHSSRAA